MIDRYLAAIIKLRWLVIVVAAAITAYLAPGLGDIRFDSSSQGSVPRGDVNQAYFEEIKDDFGNDQVAMLVVIGTGELGVFAPETLTKIQRLSDQLGQIDGVDDVVSLTNSRFLSGVGGDELTHDLIIPAIPASDAEARALRDDVLANPLFHRTLVAADGRAAAINVFLENKPDSVLIATRLDDQIANLVESARGPEEVHYAGLIHTRMAINKTMQRDLRTFVPLSFLLILVILLISFRNAVGVAIPALTILVALVWTFGLIGRLGIPISLTSTIIPPLLIAIASSLSIHIIAGYLAQAADPEVAKLGSPGVVKKAMAPLVSPLVTAGLTTAIGFGSLLINPIPNTQKVGAFSVMGILFTLIVSFTLVPALLAALRLRKRRSDGAEHPARGSAVMVRLVDAIIDFNLRKRVLVLVVAAAVLIMSVVGMFRVTVDTDFLSYFKPDSEIRRAADVIEENLAGVSTFYVIAASDSTDIMREGEVLRGIDELQDYMEAMPNIDRATSMVNVVKLWHQAMSGDHPDSFQIPLDQEAVDAAIFLTVDQEEPAARAHYVVEDYSSLAIFVRSQLVSTSELSRTLATIEEHARELLPPAVEVSTTGTVVIFAKLVTAVIHGQRDSLLLAFGLIFLVMAALFRSARVGLIAMISNVVPIVVIFGIMGWTGISLNLGTSIVASISLGIAVDDTIHYLMHFRRALEKGLNRRAAVSDALEHVGQPVIFTSLALCLGFLVICFSDFGMLFNVGLLSAITMITCLISDLFLTSALLLTFDFSHNLKIAPRDDVVGAQPGEPT